MAELKNMTVVTSGKLRKTAYDLLDANTNLLAWKEGGRTPADIFDGWGRKAAALRQIFLTGGWHRQMLYILLAI